jgi:hypothetical protein
MTVADKYEAGQLAFRKDPAGVSTPSDSKE